MGKRGKCDSSELFMLVAMLYEGRDSIELVAILYNCRKGCVEGTEYRTARPRLCIPINTMPTYSHCRHGLYLHG